MPILSRLCRQSKTALMKKLLLLASSVLLSFSYATAGVEITRVPSDPIKTKKATQKVEFKTSDMPQEVKGADKKKAKKSKEKTTSKDGRTAPASGKQTAKTVKSVSIDDMKASASTKAQKNKKGKARDNKKAPTVSYPYYPGGNVAIREFIRKHQRYPEECKSERLRGRVEVTITIDWDGTPHSPKIKKSSGNKYMDAEALRVADMMPGWNAAEESDKPMGIEYTSFVNFRPGR